MIYKCQTTILMKSFIEAYLENPTMAIAEAQQIIGEETWFDTVDDNAIYEQLASPEFRLYEQII